MKFSECSIIVIIARKDVKKNQLDAFHFLIESVKFVGICYAYLRNGFIFHALMEFSQIECAVIFNAIERCLHFIVIQLQAKMVRFQC